jgi:predicted metal-dependent enzyme (double-stranded beta helix superfamily)
MSRPGFMQETAMSAALRLPTAGLPAACLPVLDAMLAEIAAAVARHPGRDRPHAVGRVLERHVGDPGLLAGRDCPSSGDRYARHLLAEDPDGRYAVAALVWRPGQMSRVHSHRVWCALGVHRGVLAETAFEPAGQDDPEPRACRLCRTGDISHGPADPALIHRIANLGCQEAVSIHVYGVTFDRFPTDVNQLYTET